MKDNKIPKHSPLSLDDMRVGGSSRLTITDGEKKCSASFKCYDDSVVECSGARKTCSGVEAQGYIVGVSCQGGAVVCNPPFPDVPVNVEGGQAIACKTKSENDPCRYIYNNIEYSGTCIYSLLVAKGQLYCKPKS